MAASTVALKAVYLAVEKAVGKAVGLVAAKAFVMADKKAVALVGHLVETLGSTQVVCLEARSVKKMVAEWAY
jgi:hypothetical protein